ncbi:hypothetical protein AVEN_216499-1 [Araneus ventricosus]|uniref:Uncharacterized protein n=1 Tax=Araneus ventricosus TaxID=182803 RepID=A0A4Y2D7W2_ARAVE|nr:hypothetical protein AVEN_216499-1 [Araneus ventricosus]
MTCKQVLQHPYIAVWGPWSPQFSRPDHPTNSPKARRERKTRCRENDPVLHNPEGFVGAAPSDRWKITQVDRQRELITLWLFPMLKREGERMFVVG